MSKRECFLCDYPFIVELSSNEDICPTCRDKLKDPAYLQCAKCDSLWGIVDPGPMKYGVVLEAGKAYKTRGCCFCSEEEAVSYKLVEVEEAEARLNKFPARWIRPVAPFDRREVQTKVADVLSKAKTTSRELRAEPKLAELYARLSLGKDIAKSGGTFLWFTQSPDLKSVKITFTKVGHCETKD